MWSHFSLDDSSVTAYSTGPWSLPEFAGLRVNFARYSVEKMVFEV